MNIPQTKLQARIQARNTANKLANDVFPSIIEALKQFVGQKICKVDGTLLEKVRTKIPQAPNNHPNLQSSYTTGRGYSLRLCIKTCVESQGHAHYADADVYLANLRDGVLESLYDEPKLRADYTEQEIVNARNEVTQARKALSTAEGKIFYFGEHDN